MLNSRKNAFNILSFRARTPRNFSFFLDLNVRGEIPHFARNDKTNYFSRSVSLRHEKQVRHVRMHELRSRMVVNRAGIRGRDVVLAVLVFVFERKVRILDDTHGFKESGGIGNRHRSARSSSSLPAGCAHTKDSAGSGRRERSGYSPGHCDPKCQSRACRRQRPLRSFPDECCRRENSRRHGRSVPSCWIPPRKIPGRIVSHQIGRKRCAETGSLFGNWTGVPT